MKIANIKSRKKPGFHTLFRRYIFRKTTAGGERGVQIDTRSRFRVNLVPFKWIVPANSLFNL